MPTEELLESGILAPLDGTQALAQVSAEGELQSDLAVLLPSNSSLPADVTSGMGVNRIDKHERPKGQVANKLRRLGLQVSEVGGAHSYDLLVNQSVRVTLRVAYPGLRRHRVTVGGRSYRYRYETWHFNFHHHGRLEDQYTDFFICIATNPKNPAADQVFVIPWEKVTGKTFSLHCGRTSYRGRYAPYLQAWDGIAEAAAGRNKSLSDVA